MKLLRQVTTSDFDDAENILLQGLQHDPELPGASRLIPGANTQTLVSAYPIVVSEYRCTVLCNTPTALFQTYMDASNATEAINFNSYDEEFTRGLKKYTLIPGSRNSTMNSGGDQYTSAWAKGTIHFKAGYYSKKRKRYVNGPKPIIIAKSGTKYQDYFAIGIHNLDAQDNRRAIVFVEIKKWHQIV